MILDKLFSAFTPRNKDFFNLFAQSSANLVEISRVFSEMINGETDRRHEYLRKIEALEHAGDEITHRIFTELSTNFITPFDREDISYLASSLDDIVDHIYGSAKRLDTYKIKEASQPMKRLSEIISFCASEIHIAIVGMKDMKTPVRVREAIIRINSLENQADDVFDAALSVLFENGSDPVYIIKVKEILSYMETATDKCEDVGNVIETILVKNS